jgi:serine protease
MAASHLKYPVGCASAWTFLVTVACALAFGHAQAQEPERFAPGELLIGYETESARDEAVQRFAKHKSTLRLADGAKARLLDVAPLSGSALKLRFELPRSLRVLARKDPSSELRILQDAAAKMRDGDNNIAYAHPNWIIPAAPHKGRRSPRLESSTANRASDQPTDPYFLEGYHWNYGPGPGGMNAVGAWKHTTGSRSIVVAVISSGILRRHPDIQSSGNVLAGYNFAGGKRGRARGPDDTDVSIISRGTHEAGVVGGVSTNNGKFVAGINWQVSILPIRASEAKNGGYLIDYADAIRWASGGAVKGVPKNRFPADVILVNVWIDKPCSQIGFLRSAIDTARRNGSVVVTSGGDFGKSVHRYSPAGCAGAISVAASDNQGKLAAYSDYGTTIMAPGGDFTSDDEFNYIYGPVGANKDNDQSHVWGLSGSYLAAAHVAGAIALALSAHPGWRGKPDVIGEKLRASASPVTSKDCPKPCGAGRLDAERLVTIDTDVAAPGPGTGAPQPDSPLAGTVATVSASPSRSDARPAHDAPTGAGNFDGQWELEDGSGALDISGSRWLHPELGTADVIKGKGAAAYEVHYRHHYGVTCAYRIRKTANGQNLILEAAVPTQSADYCPSGRLPKVGS